MQPTRYARLSERELERRLDAADKKESDWLNKVIAAGYGDARISELRQLAGSNKTIDGFLKAADKAIELRNEARYREWFHGSRKPVRRKNPVAYIKGRTVKKKTGRKKKRTAAQKRATANLVKLNKQRAKKKVAKKRPTKKRTVKKKTMARKRNPVSNYKVFRIRGKGDLAWLTLRGPKLGWTLTSGDAIIFAHKSQASEAAHKAAKHFGGTWVYGVAPTGKSISAIVSEFEKQTGKK